MDLAQATFVAAALSVILTAVGIAVIFITRYRDRVDLRILDVRDEGDRIHFIIRNAGGTPTQLDRLWYDDGSRADGGNMSLPVVAGRSEVTLTRTLGNLRQDRLASRARAIYVTDDRGRRSKSYALPAALVARLDAPTEP